MSLTSIQTKIEQLEKEMAAAAEGQDFELAGRLRDEIAVLRGQASLLGGTVLVRQPPPGQMGLGTHIPLTLPPKDWKRPKKPDLLTKNVKPPRGKR